MKNTESLTLTAAFLLMFTVTACKKKFDIPPQNPVANSGSVNIATLKGMYVSASIKFSTDLNVYCTVIADESSGNFYKESFVRDATGALNLKLLSSGGLYIGDSIRINLKGSVLKLDNGQFILDSVDVDKMIVKQRSGLNPQPRPVTLAALISNTASTGILLGELVRIENVEFLEKDSTYAYPSIQKFANRTLKECGGKTCVVYTSGYCNFAGKRTPEGNGTFVGIVKIYKGAPELIMRSANEINMTDPSCNSANYLTKDFEDLSLTSGGWSQKNVTGAINWSASTYSSTNFGKISNYSNGNKNCETWLISPPVDLSNSITPNLYFQNAYKYAGAPLQVLVSTNYTEGAPSSATWTQLSPTLSSGNYVFVNSGALPLSGFKSAITRIAFKYTGTTTDGSTWEIDDIVIKEN